MKAFRLIGTGHAEVQEIDRPRPGAGEVLVRVAAASFCQSDVHILHDPASSGAVPPVTLGHEIAGSIEELGEGVTAFTIGEEVAAYIIKGCGTCARCRIGEDNRCLRNVVMTPGVHHDGGLAEFIVLDANYVVATDGVPATQAAPLTDAGMTSYHAVDQARPWLRPGTWVLVIGIGGLGHLALQELRATSAVRVIAVDVDDAKLELARDLGAEVVILSGDDAVEKILAASGGVTVAYDFVGNSASVALAASVVERAGAIVVVGVGDGHVPVRADNASLGAPLGYPIVRADVHVVRPFAGGRDDLRAVLSLARQGLLSVETQTYALTDAGTALEDLAAGRVLGRAVVTR